MSSVPVIDISSLCKVSTDSAVDQHTADETIQQIQQACKDVGFFYIKGHGVEQSTVQQILNNAKTFFALPLEKKKDISIRNSKSYNGYFETSTNTFIKYDSVYPALITLRAGSEKTLNVVDIREGIYFGQVYESPDNQDQMFSSQFPDESSLTGFAETVKTYFTQISQLGFVIMKALAVGLGLKEDFFDDMFAVPALTTLLLTHYPPHPGDTGSYGVGPHTDYGMCTFVLQDDIGGLEAEIEGEWVDVKPIPGTFVINLGDCLEAWTKGLYRATKHRVRRSVMKDRYSVVLFFDPNASCLVKPLETTVTKNLSFKTNVKGMEMPFYFGDFSKSLLQKSFATSE